MSVNPQPAEPREGTRSPEPVPATVAHPSPAQKRDADPYRPARPIPAAELQPSPLDEVRQERQVTIAKEAHLVPDPFLVLATENPIEAEGTYPLPEAQLDRFMFKVVIGYPSYMEEIEIANRVTGPPIVLRQVLTLEQLREMQAKSAQVYVDPAVTAYAATLVGATRDPAGNGLPQLAKAVAYGASPRATINLVAASRCLAFIRGRTTPSPRTSPT